jgi:DNA-directed RNA polymerase specialized sigma24 family protein
MPLNGKATETTSPVLVRVSNGERSAIGECVANYGGAIWRIALGRCESSVNAERLTEDIFLDIWKSSNRFCTSGLGESSFITIVVHISLSKRREGGGIHLATGEID